MSTAVEAEPTCRVCTKDVSVCGPLVKSQGDTVPGWIGLRHLPKLGERRHGGRIL